MYGGVGVLLERDELELEDGMLELTKGEGEGKEV